jgi:hypothetical protein
MALVIRCPTLLNMIRVPDMAVVRIVPPVAVVVEIFVSDHITGEIPRRSGIIVTTIAAIAPGIKLVAAIYLFHVGIQGIGSAEGSSLSCMNPISLPIACCFALSVTRADDGVRAIFTRLDPIVPRTVDIECEVGRIDFDSIVPV